MSNASIPQKMYAKLDKKAFVELWDTTKDYTTSDHEEQANVFKKHKFLH